MSLYGNIKDDKDSLWCISVFGQWREERHSYNRSLNIVAKTAEEAIAKIRKESADVKVVSVSHKGQIDIA